MNEFRTGLAAILAGALWFAGQGGELAFDEFGGETVFVALGVAGIVALGLACWGLRPIVSGTRRGRVGIRLAVAGLAVALTVTSWVHDVGLFVFEAGWIGLGVALVRAARRQSVAASEYDPAAVA